MVNDLFMNASEPCGVVIVTPAAPYLAWAEQACGNNDGMECSGDSPNAYLVPECETEDELRRLRDRWFPQIFIEELNAWCSDPDLWPKDRSWKQFKAWFTWTWHPMVFDTETMRRDR